MNQKTIVAGAISGFVSALLVDLHAWADTEDAAFNWRKAFKRWVGGAISGAAAGAGFGSIGF